MESTEVLNIPVKHRDVIKSNDGHRKDVNTISDAKEEILISKNDEAPILPENGQTFSTKTTSSLGDLSQSSFPQKAINTTTPTLTQRINPAANAFSVPARSQLELSSSIQQGLNDASDQDIRAVEQQIEDRENLKGMQEGYEMVEEIYNINHLVKGIPRVSKNSSNTSKHVQLIFSEVIRWKKVATTSKQDDADHVDVEPAPKLQRKNRKRNLKERGQKTSCRKRSKLQYSENEGIENNEIDNEISFGCEDKIQEYTDDLNGYNNSQTELMIGKEDLAEEANVLDEKGRVESEQSSWNILDEMDKCHSSKDFSELSIETDESKAFTTIKDLAERMTKQNDIEFDQHWDQSSEFLDQFTLDGDLKYNDPYDGQDEEAVYEDSRIENSDFEAKVDLSKKNVKTSKKKVLKKKLAKERKDSKVVMENEELPPAPTTPMWPLPPLGDERNQIFSEFTKKGKRRKRLPRRDLRQYLPKVNPILKKKGDSTIEAPKTLDDYIVVRSAKAPRKAYTKYNTLENPQFVNRFNVSVQGTTSQEEVDEDTPDDTEEGDSCIEPDSTLSIKTPSKEAHNFNKMQDGNVQDTYDGESQEDVESNGESQEDIENTPKKKPKSIEGNNNNKSKTQVEQYAAMHADRNTYGCIFCNYMAPKKEWLIHLKRKHRDRNLVFCTYVKFCNMPFEFIKDLDSHIKEIHAKHSQTGPRFRDVKSYVEFEGDDNNSEKDLKPQKKLERTTFKCRFCDFRGIKRQWVLHLKTKHADKNLVFCEFSRACSLPFDNQELLDNHVKTYHETNTCDICGQEFKFRNVLREHKKVHIPEHLDPNGDPDLDTDNCWICTYCGKKYRTRKGCKAHEAFRHDRGKLRHRCSHVDAQGKACESAFYDPKELQIHQRKHTGELPFICGYCGARYISKATLVQHEKAKHLETENVECEICHKMMRKRNLPAHVKTHEGFVGLPCKVCGKKFSTIGGKNRHEKIHTADKQFECSYCGKAFVQKANMQAHERIHTGEKPYTCKFCGEGFVQGTRRNQHQAGCKMQSSTNFVTVEQPV